LLKNRHFKVPSSYYTIIPHKIKKNARKKQSVFTCRCLKRMETLSKYFTGAGNRHKCLQILIVDEISQFHSLGAGEGSKDDIFFSIGISTDAFCDGGTAVEFSGDETTDRLLVITDDGNGFAQVDRGDDVIDHEGLDGKTDKRVKGGL